MAGGFLMKTAYFVHGALVSVSPVDIPTEYKIKIRKAIEYMESAFVHEMNDMEMKEKKTKRN